MKLQEAFAKLLSSPNIASDEPIYEQYDKNVQGNTAHERGAVAASVITPFQDFSELKDAPEGKIGVVIATAGNPNLAKIDPKYAAQSAVFEATLKLACVGGEPLTMTDCLNFGNPEKKDQMGQFVAGVEGVKEASKKLNIPIVSGNVSLYNESGGKSIPPSALISVFGRVMEVDKVPSKILSHKSGMKLFLLGGRSEDLGGSEFLRVCDKEDTRLPELDYEKFKNLAQQVREGVSQELFTMASPILRGGLGVAAFGNVKLNIPEGVSVPHFLFSEDLGVLVASDQTDEVMKLGGIEVGEVIEGDVMIIEQAGEVLSEIKIESLRQVWEDRLRSIV